MSQALSDARALRALTHPVRLALLDALRAGPLTATQAGELIDESSTTCSFHLRQLARFGFVEEAGGGKGRSRPWRLVHAGWSAPAQPDDPEFTRAVQALDHVLLDRYSARVRRFIDTAATYPPEWQVAASASTSVLHLTAAETTELTAALRECIERFRDRSTARAGHPEGSAPVEVLFGAYPLAVLAERAP